MSGTVTWDRVRTAGSKLTTPLHPDDYLRLLNPLWTARELRGRVERVVPETEDAATLVIRPGWGWRFDHQPGQYVGIGIQVAGKWQWRSYSISSVPKSSTKFPGGRTIAITVRAMPEGLLSSHLVNGLEPGTIVRLAAPKGDFVLPDPPPAKLLFLVGGSGITPVMAMLRTLARRRTMPDVVLHYSSPTADRMIFRDELAAMAEEQDRFWFQELHTDTDGMLELANLDKICPDWQERATFACGPGPMLEAVTEHFEQHDLEDQLHLERFSLELGGEGGEGGTITFQNSSKSIEADGATTVLEAGEEAGIGMPYGCRMGICHTCTVTKISGRVRDLRNGEDYDQPNEQIQTCVTAAVGECTLDV